MSRPAPRRVCLVTPGHLSTNPRLVKEADALAAAGYAVNIVCARFLEWADEADHEFAGRPWVVRKVTFGRIAGRPKHLIQCLVRRGYMLAYKYFGVGAERSFHPVVPALTRAACAIKADLYIAHNLAALPAAYRAATMHGAKLGFDAEDFHSGELDETPENALDLRLTRDIERWYFPRCDYLTAASPGIAKAYASSYDVKEPLVILNVFPKADSPARPTPNGTNQPSPSLYWFSQTIGPDRGLETVVEAIACSLSRPTLYLRGNPSPGYQEQLTALAEKLGIGDRLRFLPPAPPGGMVRLAAGYDIGMATEVSRTSNRDICLTNKIFTYLLAGVPVLATDTSAQSEMAMAVPDAVFVYAQKDARGLAGKIDELLLSLRRLSIARQAAWTSGQANFNWDLEQIQFVKLVESVVTC